MVDNRVVVLLVRLRAAVAGWGEQQVGQGLVEYSLLLMLLVLVAIGILRVTGTTISEVWYDTILASFPH